MESIKEVERVINKEKPDIVALELDRGRFRALVCNEKKGNAIEIIRRIGIKGYLFSLLGSYIERKLGKIVGIKPGEEMIRAAEIAKENGCRIALIDQDINITLRRFSKELTWKEKFRFLFDIFKGIFKGEKIPFDLKKVPSKEVIGKMIGFVKKRYPNIYKVLVEERDNVMAQNLYSLMQNYNVVAIVGAGHEEGIIEGIRCLEKKR